MINDNNDNNDNEQITISIVGFEKTGKSILIRYLKDGYKNLNFKNYLSTIGAAYGGKKLLLYKKILFNIEIWDTSGQLKFLSISKLFMKKAQIIFILFNYNDRRTFNSAKLLLDERKNEQQLFVLVGAKYDLKITTKKEDDVVHEEEVLELANEKNALCAHLSLLEKYSNGVNELI